MGSAFLSILVTGASGVVGRNFIEAAKEDFLIYALSRRSQENARVPLHPNIKWIQVDIADFNSLKATVFKGMSNRIPGKPAVDFVLHLASYYDYNYTPNVEYERTNVVGTRNMLELSKMLNPRRFVFAGSLAAVKFPPVGGRITEKSPADALHPYAVSKRKGEEIVREFSKYFPCFVVRPAAVFTDWCEYRLLYHFLRRWLSRRWGSRVLCGKGEWAVPFLHAHDLSRFLLALFRESGPQPSFDVYIAGPDCSTSQRELFLSAAACYFGSETRPLLLPKPLAAPLIVSRDFLMRLCGRRPFERPWMLKYVDRKLEADSSYTRQVIPWEPDPDFHILRRMSFIIENFRNRPDEMARANL